MTIDIFSKLMDILQLNISDHNSNHLIYLYRLLLGIFIQ